MVEFDNLPPTSRSLILTKLALEIVSADCKSILELARKRNQNVHEIWRDICLKTAQPPCDMPRHVIAPSTRLPAATSLESMTAPKKTEAVSTVATLSLVKQASPSSAPRGHRPQNRRVMLAVGLGGIVVAGIALFSVVSNMNPHGSPQTATVKQTEIIRVKQTEVIRVGVAKPGETIRPDAAKPSRDPVAVPPPQGTVKRMDAISKAFSKK